jgi:hypothetical protein
MVKLETLAALRLPISTPVVDLPTGATTDENRKLSIPIEMNIILILRVVLEKYLAIYRFDETWRSC